MNKDTITLPREMDEDLWYIVGKALGAESPEQCSRAAPLWNKLVARADRDAAHINSVQQSQPQPKPKPLQAELFKRVTHLRLNLH